MIEKKDMYKVKRVFWEYKDYNNKIVKNEKIGILTEPSRDYADYILRTLSGEEVYLRKENIIKVGIVRNLPEKLRNLAEEEARILKEIRKEEKIVEEKIKEFKKEIEKKKNYLKSTEKEKKEAYFEEYKLYTSEDFSSKIKEYMRSKRRKGDKYGDSAIFDNVYFTTSNEILISLCVLSEKYAREGLYGLVYQEYDGSMNLYDDNKKELNLVKKHLSNYDAKTKRFNEVLKEKKIKGELFIRTEMGDKNRFILSLDLQLEVKDKTEENLEKIKEVLNVFM